MVSEQEATGTPKEPFLNKAWDFLRVSPQLHFPAAVSFYFGASTGFEVAKQILEGRQNSASLTIGAALALGWSLGAEKSALGNYQAFARMKKALAGRGWDRRIVETDTNWWCERFAARTAARDLGYGQEWSDYARDQKFSWLCICHPRW